MADDLWSKYPDRYSKCGACDGSGKEKCRHCRGRGMTYSPHRAWDFYVHGPKLRYGSIRCDPCKGRGEVDCFRCNGDGSIASTRSSKPLSGEESIKSEHQATPADSLEDLKREFNAGKEKAAARILECRKWPMDYRWKLRDQVRAIEIESPFAHSEMLRLSRPMTKTYETSNRDARILTLIMEDLERIASRYSDRAGIRWLAAQMPPADVPKPLGVGSAKSEAQPKDHCTRCRRSNLQVHNDRLWCSFCEDWAAT